MNKKEMQEKLQKEYDEQICQVEDLLFTRKELEISEKETKRIPHKYDCDNEEHKKYIRYDWSNWVCYKCLREKLDKEGKEIMENKKECIEITYSNYSEEHFCNIEFRKNNEQHGTVSFYYDDLKGKKIFCEIPYSEIVKVITMEQCKDEEDEEEGELEDVILR